MLPSVAAIRADTFRLKCQVTMKIRMIYAISALSIIAWAGAAFFLNRDATEHHIAPVDFPTDGTASNSVAEVKDAKIVPRLPEGFDTNKIESWLARQRLGAWTNDPQVMHAYRMQRADRLWNWKRPINFWGVVVDERGDPVPNTQVTFSWTDLSADGSSTKVVVSDENGWVSLTNKQGYCLGVRPGKEGFYVPREGVINLNYAEPWDPSYHEPDRTRPILIRLRSMGTSEPLIHRRGLDYNVVNGILWIDLAGQRIADRHKQEKYDLQFKLSSSPDVNINGQRRFDWTVEVSADEGGLVAFEEEFPFLAPEDGYHAIITFFMEAEDPNWSSGHEGAFFFKTKGGQHYGRIKFRASPSPRGERPSIQILEYFLNPAGSRNLEYSPELDVSERYYVPR